MKPIVAVLATVVLLCSVAMYAGEGTSPASFAGQVEVNLVNLRVVATHHGNPVTDLGPEDFLVLEDGEPREVTHFARFVDGRLDEAPNGPDVSLPADESDQLLGRSVVLVFDLNTLLTPELLRAGRAVREAVTKAPDGLSWSIVLLGLKPVCVLQWTSERAEVLRVLGELDPGRTPTSPVDGRMLPGDRVLTSESGGDGNAASRIGAQGDYMLSSYRDVTSMKGLPCSLRATEQQMILPPIAASLSEVFVSGINQPGGKACVLLHGGEQVGGGCQRAASAHVQVDLRTFSEMFNDVARLASTAGFTLYTVDAHGLTDPAATMGRSPAVARRSLGSSVTAADGFRIISSLTGGTHRSSNNLAQWVEAAVGDMGTFYSLAFVSNRAHDGEAHGIKVEVRRRGVRVRHANSRFDLDPRILLVEALTLEGGFRKDGGTLAVDVEVAPVAAEGAGGQARALVSTPLAGIALVPCDGFLTGRLSLFAAVSGPGGGRSEVEEKQLLIRIPEGDPSLEEDGMHVDLGIDLQVSPESSEVAILVYDQNSGSYGMTSVILDPPGTTVIVSGGVGS